MRTPGDTAILCRPDQLLEAAVVVSCLASDRVPLVLTIEPAPVSPDGFRALYETYLDARAQSLDRMVGSEYRTPLEHLSDADARQMVAAMQAHRDALERLTAPRSWLRQNQRYHSILEKASCKTAVLLFTPGPDDLKQFYANRKEDLKHENARQWEAEDILGPEIARRFVLPSTAVAPVEGADVIRYRDIPEMTNVLWAALRRADSLPPDRVTVRSVEPVAVLSALAEALQRGCVIDVAAGAEAPPPRWHSSRAGECAEAVLVEACDARSIVGVLYAHQSEADLHIIETPDRAGIDAALENYLSQEREAVAAYREAAANANAADTPADDDATRGAPPKKLRTWLTGGGRAAAIAGIEKAVSAAVPPPIIDAIGALPLTVFTDGVPYQFVRSATANWSHKAIGHVVSDACLIVYTEMLFQGAPPSDASFAVIVDPGFFAGHSERADVLETMAEHSEYPILFPEEAASLDAVLRISNGLPVDMLFFLTHGSDDSIILGDVPLERHQVVQWLTFPTNPMVFNNSCLSWAGVGQEFVRAGARGYVGTLWSIDSREAADLARIAMARVVDGDSFASAVRATGVSAFTELAYVFVGTANARLRAQVRHSPEINPTLNAASALLRLVGRRSEAALLDRESALNRHLYARVVELLARPDAQAEPAKVLPVRLQQLRCVSGRGRYLGLSEEEALALAADCLSLAEAASSDPAEVDRNKAGILRLRAAIWEEFGKPDAATRDLEQASERETGAEGKLADLIERVSILKKTGSWQPALEAARQAKATALQLGNDGAAMQVIGEMAQILKRLRLTDEGLEQASEGYALAVKLEDRHEQIVFKQDEASLLNLLGRHREAAVAAEEAGRLARKYQFADLDLTSYGLLVQSHLGAGDIATARTTAVRGLNAARKREHWYEVASFLTDLGSIELKSEKPELAEEHFREAVGFLIPLGRVELILVLNGELMRIAVRSGDWERITRAVVEQLFSHTFLPEGVRGTAVAELVGVLRQAVLELPGPKADALGKIVWAASELAKKHPDATDLRFAGVAAETLRLWMARSPDAARGAAMLDPICRYEPTWADLITRTPA